MDKIINEEDSLNSQGGENFRQEISKDKGGLLFHETEEKLRSGYWSTKKEAK